MKLTPGDLRLDVFANWMLRPCTLGEFIDERIGFLRRLQPLHPLFREGLHLLGDSRKNSPALDADLSGLESFVLKRGWDREAGPTCFENLGPDDMATRQTKSRLGFGLSVDNLRPHQKDHVQIRLNGGSTNPDQGGGVGIKLPYSGAPEFADPAFLRELLRVVVDYWQPEHAGITNSALCDAVHIRKSYADDGCWLTYLDDPEAVKVLPLDVHHEPFGPGVLFSLQPEPPLMDVEVAIEKAIRVRDALLPGQWLVNRYWRGKTPQQPPAVAAGTPPMKGNNSANSDNLTLN